MLVLLDRAFDASAFLREVAATGAQLLARGKSTRNPPVLAHLPDGSYLSCLDGLAVRIIEAEVTVTGADGSGVRRQLPADHHLVDHRRYPAAPWSGSITSGGVRREVARCEWSCCLEVQLLRT